MYKHSRIKLAPLKIEPEKQVLEENSVSEHKDTLTEMDLEIECPLCHETMELQSNFDKLMYCCVSCCFLLKCV
jgi:hypothetical protein